MGKKSRTDVLECPELSQVSPLQMLPAALRRLEAFYEENSPKPAMKNGRYGWPIWKDEPL